MLLLFSKSMVSAAATMRQPPVDIVSGLQPVAGVMELPLVVAVSNQSGVKTPAELIHAGKTKPGGLNHGNGAMGGVAHITSELLADAGKMRITNVGYKGGAQVGLDVAAGIVDFTIGTHSSVDSLAEAGRLKLIATTSGEVSRNRPELPTMASVVPGFDENLWIGVWTTPGTPIDLVRRYNRELLEISKSSRVKELVQIEDGVLVGWSPEQFGERVKQAYERYKRIATEKNITTE
jgi:tripartite-type tricarboxylate transporter receptor subunit TctC